MLTTWVDEELEALESQAMRRKLRLPDTSLINFASNNYLGLARHPDVIAGAEAALHAWGAGAVSSRLLSGHTALHAELEEGLAQFVGKESALVFPAGYMANVGVLTALAGPSDAVILDRLCHASLVDAARLSGARLLVYSHADVSDAERVLQRAASYRRRILVTESLFSMDGDAPDLPALRALARQYDALAVVDEAHALGVAGPKGQGLSQDWDLVMGTLSKSFGSQGGFAAGSRTLMDYLVNKARSFIFTTGLSPACVGAALAALQVMKKDPTLADNVRTLSATLRQGLTERGWNILRSESQIIPILVGEADVALALSERLRAQGFYAPAIRPPAVHAHECRIRLSVTAEHTAAQIDHLLNSLGGPS
jgi:8-amino-7-oxononanoate synthase